MSAFFHNGIFALPQLALVLGIMVLVHEFGHFAVAKLCGVRVETFAIGFGKRLLGFVHNGTDYCINLIPLGGYVKMAGVGDEPISGSEQRQASADPGELQNHPRWQRTLITLAGPFANFLLAFALLTGLYVTSHEVPVYMTQATVVDYVTPNTPMARTGIQSGDTIVLYNSVANPTPADIQNQSLLHLNGTVPFSYLHLDKRVDTTMQVENKSGPRDFDVLALGMIPVMQSEPIQVASLADFANGPAARAGLQPGDKILSVDGIALHSVEALIPYMQNGAGKPMHLLVQRAGVAQPIPMTITPVQLDTAEGKGWRLGFSRVPPPVHYERLPFAAAASESFHDNLKGSLLIFQVLHGLFTRQVSVKAFESPIGMGAQVHQAFEEKTNGPIISLMAMISLQLGIFNLLPIPILDGGMIVFLAVESLMRRDLNQQLKERIYQVAFVCLILFAAVVIFNDITRMVPHAHT